MFRVHNKGTRTKPCSSVSIVNSEQVNAGWEVTHENAMVYEL